MADYLAELAIKITTEDKATSGLQAISAAVTKTAGTADTAFQAASNSANSFGDKIAAQVPKTLSFSEKVSSVSTSFVAMGSAVNTVMNIFDRYDLTQITVENAQIRLQKSQEAYTDAVAKFGPESDQALSALQSLEIAQNKMDATNIRATSSYVMMGIAVVALVPQVLSVLGAVQTLATGGSIAIGTLNVTLATVAPYLLVIGLAVGAAYVLWNKYSDSLDKNTKAHQSNLSAAQLAIGVQEDLHKTQIALYTAQVQVTSIEERMTQLRGASSDATTNYKTAVENLTKANDAAAAIEAKLLILINKGMTDTPMYTALIKEMDAAKKNVTSAQDALNKTEEVYAKYRDTAITNTPAYKLLELQLADAKKAVTDEQNKLNTSLGSGSAQLSIYNGNIDQTSIKLGIWGTKTKESIVATDNWKTALGSAIDSAIQLLGNFVKYGAIFWDAAIQKVYEADVKIYGFLSNMFNSYVTWWGKIFSYLGQVGTDIYNGIVSTWNKIWNYLFGGSVIPDIYNAFVKYFGMIGTAISTAWASISSTTSTVWNGIKATLSGIWAGLQSTASTVMSVINSVWTSVNASGIAGAWNGVKSALQGVWSSIQSAATAAYNSVVSTWNAAQAKASIPVVYAAPVVQPGQTPSPVPVSSNPGGGGGSSSGGTYSPGYSSTPSYPSTPRAPSTPASNITGGNFGGGYGSPIYRAEGGIAEKPTAGIFGEAGAEALIPLPRDWRTEGLGKKGVTVNISFGTVYGVPDIERAIDSALKQVQRNIKSLGG